MYWIKKRRSGIIRGDKEHKGIRQAKKRVGQITQVPAPSQEYQQMVYKKGE